MWAPSHPQTALHTPSADAAAAPPALHSHLGELVGGTTSDLGNAQGRQLRLQVLKLRKKEAEERQNLAIMSQLVDGSYPSQKNRPYLSKELLLVLAPQLMCLDPRCGQVQQQQP